MRIEIRGRHIEVTDGLRAHGERSLGFALWRVGERIARVTVHLLDVNGPRGGVDKCCRIEVRLRPTGSVFVEEAAADMYAALDRAAGRVGRSVGRKLGRGQARGLNLCERRTSGEWLQRPQPRNEA